MISNIKNRINNYLGIDTLELFDGIDMARVFGGSIRDCIADQNINDIDILCGAESEKGLMIKLERLGYKYYSSLSKGDIIGAYKSKSSKINEPKTFIKGDKIVQLIRPKSVLEEGLDTSTKNWEYLKLYKNLLSGVDISCCGVSFDGEDLYENYPNAITHCLIKKFRINENSIFINPERISDRIHKLVSRGWTESKHNNIQDNRDISIDVLTFDNNIKFIQEYHTYSKTKLDFVKWVVENSKSF